MKSGFLSEEKPPAPVSAAQLETKFEEALVEAKRLREVENPEERPFDSRYEERDLLGKMARQAAANAAAEAEGSAAARRARVIEALANGLIGKNFMETEEPGSAQAKLEAAIAGLEGVAEESAAHVEVLIINKQPGRAVAGRPGRRRRPKPVDSNTLPCSKTV